MMSARSAIVDAVTNGEKPFSSPIYALVYIVAPMLAIYSAFVFLIEVEEWRSERIWVWSSILTALAFSILTTGRTWILQLVVGLTGIFLLKNRRFSVREAWKFGRWPLVAFLALFSVLVVVDKDTSGLEGGTTEAMTQFVFAYSVTPMAGFDYVLHHASEYKYDPNHTFRQVLSPLARVSGLRYTPPPALDDFVWVPLPTNVYTVFKFYYVDFGLGGMLITMFLIGAAQTWLFRKALMGADFYVFLFAISLYPLIMVAFDDEYSLIANHAEGFIFAVLYFGVLRRLSSHGRAAYAVPEKSKRAFFRSESGAGPSPLVGPR